MDGAVGVGAEETKAPRIAAIDGDGASTRASVPPVEQQQRPAPLPAAGLAASADDGPAAAQSRGEEVDDEQVERFYALLANIRALRGLHSAGDGGGRGRKRAREAKAPWRPAFRMEDFEEEVSKSQCMSDARRALKNQQGASGGGVRRPAAAAAADHEEDQVAEARGRKLGRRVAAQG